MQGKERVESIIGCSGLSVMSGEDNRKSIGGGTLMARPNSNEHVAKPSSAAAAAATATPPPTKKIIIKSADMPPDLQREAVDIAVSAFEKCNVEKDVAEHIKKVFDKRHGPTWHCIVGRNFGSYVTHETNHFVYFYLDQKAVLLFKSG